MTRANRPACVFSRAVRAAGMHLAAIPLVLLLCSGIAVAQSGGTETGAPPAQKAEGPKQSVVRGKVVRADNGQPVRRARVFLTSNVATLADQQLTATDAHGKFVLHNLPAGKYLCLVFAPGLTNSHFDRQTPFVLDGENEVEITVTVVRGAAINGRVRYADQEPVVKQQLVLFREQGENAISEVPFGTWFTNDRGEYRLAGLPAGTYVVGLCEVPKSRSPYGTDTGDPRTGMATIFYPSAASIADARRVTVSDGDEINDINIELNADALFAITGRVQWKGTVQSVEHVSLIVTRKGEATASVPGGTMIGRSVEDDSRGDSRTQDRLNGYFADSNSRTTMTDSTGKWSFSDLTPGHYLLEARAALKPPTTTRPAVDESEGLPNFELYNPIIIKRQLEVSVADRDLSELVIELSPGASIAGIVADEGAGGIVEAVNVTAAVSGGISASVSSASSARDGTFNLRGLPAGPLSLDASIPTQSGRYVRSMTLAGVDLLREPFNVTVGAQITGAQIQLGADLATLSGKVVRSDGSPAVGAVLLLAIVDRTRWARRSAYRSVHCDPDGKFSLLLPPGQYLAFTWPGGVIQVGGVADFARRHANEASLVTVSPNEQKQIELPVLIDAP